MSKIKKFTENWSSEDIKPRGVMSSTGRPPIETGKIDAETLRKQKEEMQRNAQMHSKRVDPYFLQEVSDRLFGPDSEEYIKALKELNNRFRPKEGRVGHDIFKEEGISESIALDYLEHLYDIGGLSSDAYDITLAEDSDRLKSFDKLENAKMIRKKVLRHLNSTGAISGDVYDLEMENL